jgi:hypothetical protein
MKSKTTLIATGAASLTIALAARADHPTISLERGTPGPITTASAIPLPEGVLTLTTQAQFIFNDEISDAALIRFSELDEDIHSTESLTSLAISGAYGVSDNITLGIGLPYIWRSNLKEAGHHDEEGEESGHGHEEVEEEEEEGSVERLGDSNGIGDLAIYTQMRILGDDSTDHHLSLIAGLKTPTGRTGVRTREGELFEAEHQPGSGSWDPIAGLAFTRQAGPFSFDASVLYSFVTEGTQDSNLGDIFNYNVAASYRILSPASQAENHHPHHGGKGKSTLPPATHHHDGGGLVWDLILEANGDRREKVEIHGVNDDNTGGNLTYLSAGSRWGWGDGWSVTVSAGVPIVKDLNGVQSEPNARVLVGLSKAF